MRKNLLVAALLVSAVGAFGQGAVNFNNRATTAGAGAQAPVVAPIFGVDPTAPTEQRSGNPISSWNGTNGPTPVPQGTQTYRGTPLNGTGFTATLWAADSQAADSAMVQIVSVSFRTAATASLQGFWATPPTVPTVPGVPGADAVARAKFQVRVWDNKGGTITSWQAVLDPANNGVARGWSAIFSPNFALGAGTTLPPNLLGLESFQLFIVPEPSVIALGVLGAGCLFLLRRRK
jgi:hypothetical protein